MIAIILFFMYIVGGMTQIIVHCLTGPIIFHWYGLVYGWSLVLVYHKGIVYRLDTRAEVTTRL